MTNERLRVAFIGAGKQANWQIKKAGGTPDPTKEGWTSRGAVVDSDMPEPEVEGLLR